MQQVPSQRETVQLEYAAETLAPPLRRPWWLRWGTVFVALIAVTACFIPFTSMIEITPWMEASDIKSLRDDNWQPANINVLVLVGLSFMMALPAATWKARLLIPAPTRRWERRVALVIGMVGLAPPLVLIGILSYGIVEDLRDGAPNDNDLPLLFFLVAIGLGFLLAAGLLALRLKRAGVRVLAVDVVLMSSFLAMAAMCLIAFAESPAIGWFLSLFVALAWLAEWAILWHLSRRSGTPIAT